MKGLKVVESWSIREINVWYQPVITRVRGRHLHLHLPHDAVLRTFSCRMASSETLCSNTDRYVAKQPAPAEPRTSETATQTHHPALQS